MNKALSHDESPSLPASMAGVAIVKSIVDVHGGSVTVTSDDQDLLPDHLARSGEVGRIIWYSITSMSTRQDTQRPLGENLRRGTMRRMRRLIVLIIMLIVPLQFAWATAAALHGHMGQNVAAVGIHAHDHDYHDVGHADHGGMDKDHNKDEHHGGHCHHVLSLVLPESGLTPGLMPSGGRILHPPAIFFTRTPPLLDRPPLARA